MLIEGSQAFGTPARRSDSAHPQAEHLQKAIFTAFSEARRIAPVSSWRRLISEI